MTNLLATYLEMKAPPHEDAFSAPVPGITIEREALDHTKYLDLYRAIGTPLQWDQRQRMPVSELRSVLINPTNHLYVLRLDGQAVGLCEFDGIGTPDVELTHFGLIASVQGQRLGPYLLDRALRTVWSYAPRRVWLHTDTNDHPKALSTYQRAGFRIYSQRVEAIPD